MGGSTQVRIEGQLGEAGAVAQIDKDQPAMIAATQDPAHQADFLADMGGAQITAEVGAFPVA
jgi:hypothetical protein